MNINKLGSPAKNITRQSIQLDQDDIRRYGDIPAAMRSHNLSIIVETSRKAEYANGVIKDIASAFIHDYGKKASTCNQRAKISSISISILGDAGFDDENKYYFDCVHSADVIARITDRVNQVMCDPCFPVDAVQVVDYMEADACSLVALEVLDYVDITDLPLLSKDK